MPERKSPRIWLLALPLLGLSLSCEDAGPKREKPATATKIVTAKTTGTVKAKPPPLPVVTAEVSRVAIDWKDGQQTFTLTLTNHGEREATVRAIVYAKNDSVKPPRRGISPATAYPWFQLAHSRDGDLSARDIERNWNIDAFGNGRSGKLVSSWPATLRPGASQAIDAAHVLEDKSPHPAWSGKPLARAGYKEYHIWLFTPDGECFWQKVFPVDGNKGSRNQ